MKVGNYSYPLYRITSLLKDTRILYEKFGRKDVTREHIAQVLGQTATSGGFGQKVADLRSYGLVAGSATKYSVSEIGAKATFGTESERIEAMDKAVRLIDLWMRIYEKCSAVPISTTFWLDLADITGIERPEAQNKAEAVLKAYLDDMKFFVPAIQQQQRAEPEKPQPSDDTDRPGAKATTETPQNVAIPSKTNIPQGCSYLYHPELPAPIVINSVRTFKAAKIFWEAIEEEWTAKAIAEKTPANTVEPVENERVESKGS